MIINEPLMTRGEVQSLIGYELTDDEWTRFKQAVDYSSVPGALTEVAFSMFEARDE